MDADQYFLIPFYEYMKTIIGITPLQIKNANSNDKHSEYHGNFITEFSLNFDNNLLLTESRKHKSNRFDIRLVMRICKFQNNFLQKNQNSLVDCFPENLKICINGQPVQLSSYLPYDRYRRPGRMNPRLVDITDLILDSNNSNPHTCNIYWVQDDLENQFNFALYLVRRRSFDELLSILMKYRILSVQNTINLLSERIIIHPVNNKSNIEYMFQDLKVFNTSLVCPLSLSRMKIPVRGGNCTHLKCFDLMSYLIINFKKPTWICPICDKKAFFCLLKIDGLIFSIINDKRSNLIDEIKLNENGQWKSYDEFPDENSDTNNFYDIPENYYSFEINDEKLNDRSKTQRRSETVSGTELNKDSKNILPISDWMSLKNEFISSNVTNVLASLENNTISNGANSKCSLVQTPPSKKSTVSNNNLTNVPISSKTRVFQENWHQTNLMPNSNNNTNSNNLKRIHSSSDSSNEKEIPAKKPTLDSRSVPKVNAPKTVDEDAHTDESNNNDSDTTNNLITNYNQFKSSSHTIIQVVNKENYVYRQIESQLCNEISQYNNFWSYRTTGIPNNFKFYNSPKRTMFITIIISPGKANIIDIFPDIKEQTTTSNMRIHAINNRFTLFTSVASRPIQLEKHTTLEIFKGDGREKCIIFQFEQSSTIVMIELLYPVKPPVIFSRNEPLWTYNIDLNDFKNLKSFVRLQLSQQQEDKLTYFVAAHYATLRESLSPAVVALTVLNFDGELIVNSIITPRNSIKHYQSHAHGLKEEQVKNNWDSEDFKVEIRKILDGRILVGLVVKDFLEAVDFPLSRVLGIRDLGCAKCLEKSNLEKCKGIFRIKYLENQIIPDEKPFKVDLQSENDARSIRKIYLKLRDQWEDHIVPDKQCVATLATVNKTSLHVVKKSNDQKAMTIMPIENELCTLPSVSTLDKQELIPEKKNNEIFVPDIHKSSVAESTFKITPDMEIKSSVTANQIQKQKELPQSLQKKNIILTSKFNKSVSYDPIYCSKPGVDKKVISNQDNAKHHLEVNSIPLIQSSNVCNNEQTDNLNKKSAYSYPLLIASPLKISQFINAKFIYTAMNDYFLKNHSEKNQTYWHFHKCTFIPNHIKVPNSPERELLAIMVKEEVHENLSNLLPNSFQQMDSHHMVIHAVNAPLVVFIPSVFEPVELSIQNSLVIKNGDGREKNLKIHVNRLGTIIVIELYKKEKEFTVNNEVYEDWVYNISHADLKLHLSFTRKNIGCEEEHDKILCISAKYVSIRGEILSFPVSISIENYEGHMLVNAIITPREPIKHYQSHSHGLKEPDILGKWDGHLCKIELHSLLDGKILVGFAVFDFLNSIEFPFKRILGIRDLSTGKCFDKMGLCQAHGAYRLDYLLKNLCPKLPSNNSDRSTESEVRKINVLYHLIENQWEDHIYPVIDKDKRKNLIPSFTQTNLKDL